MPNSYKKFCDMVTGYRMFRVLEQAVESGIIDLLDAGAKTADELISSAGLRQEEGERFISCLLDIGILTENSKILSLSKFSQNWLATSSPTSQRGVLQFEPILMNSWAKLGIILQKGQGALIQEHSPEEYKKRLQLYQKAMSEAAAVRSVELWNAVTDLPEHGTIIDIGAGDGTYLREFLKIHPKWQAVACDLPDVCLEISLDLIPQNLKLYPCNILDNEEVNKLVSDYRSKADLLLFSNVCHCYSYSENFKILTNIMELLKNEGLLVMHDFLHNTNDFSTLYDLHMMTNTYNGQCYTLNEMLSMLHIADYENIKLIELPSYSTAIIAKKLV